MTLALALKHGSTPLRVHLIDSKPRGSFVNDPRALALSHGTRQLIETMHAWNAAAGTPIHDIHVSQSGGFGRTVITREEQRIEALGYVMRYRDLAAALDAKLDADAVLDAAEVVSTTIGPHMTTTVIRRNGAEQRISARLVVHAEGTPGASPDVRVRDYHQHAVLAEVRPEPGHKHRAWERFTPDGPLALLPLGEDYSVVFTVPPEKADAMMAMDDTMFLSALQQQFGTRLRFTTTSPRARYPLALRLRENLVATREVWIGNAAQTLHPVSGQGFNLGIRDAWELADKLFDACYGNDPGTTDRLAAYAAGRRLDRAGSSAFTDGSVRTFSNDLPPLRFARGLGLLALDLCRPTRSFVARRMIWGARG
ncbi:MAG: FAD-dependent monooxygenase [Betaproteobacteria bacterium]|nr:FAD-dependent monooxygenase [Betaproteobacteria bacterium]